MPDVQKLNINSKQENHPIIRPLTWPDAITTEQRKTKVVTDLLGLVPGFSSFFAFAVIHLDP